MIQYSSLSNQSSQDLQCFNILVNITIYAQRIRTSKISVIFKFTSFLIPSCKENLWRMRDDFNKCDRIIRIVLLLGTFVMCYLQHNSFSACLQSSSDHIYNIYMIFWIESGLEIPCKTDNPKRSKLGLNMSWIIV